MAGKRKFKADTVIAALIAAKGIKSAAARTLKCSRNTIDSYIEAYPEIAEAYDTANEIAIDESEDVVFQIMRNGEKDADRLRAAMFHLTHKGKHRGWIPRQEVQQENVGDITVVIEPVTPGKNRNGKAS